MSKIGNAIIYLEEKIDRINESIKEIKNEEPMDGFSLRIITELESERQFYCNQLYSLTDGEY